MPATSKAQRRLMAAAERGANFPLARKVRKSMTKKQMHDFAATKAKDMPTHKAAHRAMPKRTLASMSEGMR